MIVNKTTDVLLELGRLARKGGRPVEALRHYQAAINLDNQSGEAWYGRAEALADQGQFRDAIEAYTRATELDPEHYSAIGLFAIGNCHIGRGQRQLAITAYDRALQESPRLTRIWHNRGTALFELGRYEEAATSYGRALEIEPTKVETQIWRAYCLERMGRQDPAHLPSDTPDEIATAWMQIGTHEYKGRDPERALEAFERALKAKPSMGYALSGRGACLAWLGRPDEALQSFDRAISLDDEARPIATMQRAQLLKGLERQGTAADAYQRVLDASPDSIDAQEARAIALQALERHEEALQSLAIVKKLDPLNTETCYLEGLSYEALGRFAEAADCFGHFLERSPDQSHAWFRHAGCLSILGQSDKALECFEKAIALGLATAETWLQKGGILTLLDRFAEAIPCFDKALEQKPDLDVALYTRGVCNHHLGQHEDAIRDFDQVLEQGTPSSHSVMALHFKARSLAALGQTNAVHSCEVMEQAYRELAEDHIPQSAELFKKALALDPTNAAASLRVSAFLIEHGSLAAAVDEMARTLVLRPRKAVLWCTRGALLCKLDRFDEADECYAKAIEVDPLYAPALRNRAIRFFELGNFQAALDLYDRALALEGQNGNAWYGRGVCLERLERLPEAVESFRRAVEYVPNDAEAWKDLGTCLARLKHYSEAIAAWKQASRFDSRIDLQESMRQLQNWTEGQLHVQSMRAYTLFEQGRFQEAAAYFDAALVIDPREEGLWNDRGLCAEHLEGPERAIEYFDRALAIDEENAQTWYNKGVSLMNLKKPADSVAAFKKVLAIHHAKDLPPDQNLLHGLHNLGMSLMMLGKKEEALDQFDEVLRLAREDPERWQEEAKGAQNLKRALLASTKGRVQDHP
jgi:tetratricopeptide (TPR) repeat protein